MTAGSLPAKILIVDDEPPIRRFLRTSLTAQGYEIVEAENAQDALRPTRAQSRRRARPRSWASRHGRARSPQARPGSGSDVPVIVLSSRTNEPEKVKALDLGADDYVTKPFGIDELLARLRAALRHRLQQQGERPIFKIGDLAVDLVRRTVTVRGEDVKLTPREYRPAAIARRSRRQGSDAQVHPARNLGVRSRRAISCESTSARCARRSNPRLRRRSTS